MSDENVTAFPVPESAKLRSRIGDVIEEALNSVLQAIGDDVVDEDEATPADRNREVQRRIDSPVTVQSVLVAALATYAEDGDTRSGLESECTFWRRRQPPDSISAFSFYTMDLALNWMQTGDVQQHPVLRSFAERNRELMTKYLLWRRAYLNKQAKDEGRRATPERGAFNAR